MVGCERGVSRGRGLRATFRGPRGLVSWFRTHARGRRTQPDVLDRVPVLEEGEVSKAQERVVMTPSADVGGVGGGHVARVRSARRLLLERSEDARPFASGL